MLSKNLIIVSCSLNKDEYSIEPIKNIIKYINEENNELKVFYLTDSKEHINNLFNITIADISKRPNINNIYYINDNEDIFNATNNNHTLHQDTGRWNLYLCGYPTEIIEQLIDNYLNEDAEITILKDGLAYNDKDEHKRILNEFDNLGVKFEHIIKIRHK